MNKAGLASELQFEKKTKSLIARTQNQIIRSNLEKAGRIRFCKKCRLCKKV